MSNRARAHRRHRRDAGQARVQLAQVELAGVDIDQVVDLEEPAVALGRRGGRPAASVRTRARSRCSADKASSEDVVAAPAALVRGQLGVAGEVAHDRADDGAVAGDYALDGRRAAVDPLHHLQLLADEVAGGGDEVALATDEERGLAGVAVRGLHDQVGPELASQRQQLLVGRRAAHPVRHRRHAGLVAELGGDDLGVQPVAQGGARQRDLQARVGRRGSSVSSSRKTNSARPPLVADPVQHLLMREEVVVDVLDRPRTRGTAPSLGTNTCGCVPLNESK